MRRLAAIILTAAVFAAGIYAYTDSFAATSSNPVYSALIDAVKNGQDEETVTGLYQEYMDESLTMTEMARIEYHLARYFKDMGNEAEAKRHVELGKEFLAGIGEDEAACLTGEETVSTDTYNPLDDRINILYKDGTVKDIADASDMLNIQVLTKKVEKHYLCYYRL